MKTYFKEKRFFSAKYREFIRSQPPLDKPDSKERSTLHHIKATKHGGDSGMGMTSDDSKAIPLSATGHMEQEIIGETAFFNKYNIDPRSEIKRLLKKYQTQLNR